MNIQSARWSSADQTIILATIDGIEMSVPNVMGNRERQALAEWEAEGNTIASYVAPPVVLPTLSPRQIRLALLSTGTTLADVDAIIDALTDPAERETAKVEWEYATSFELYHPLIAAFGVALGYTLEQMKTLWLWASDL